VLLLPWLLFPPKSPPFLWHGFGIVTPVTFPLLLSSVRPPSSLPPQADTLFRSPELSESLRFDANPADFWELKLSSPPLLTSPVDVPSPHDQWIGLTPLSAPQWPLPDFVLTFDCYEASLHSTLHRLNMTLVPLPLLPPSHLLHSQH
jgi:hypothetical protein